jgi:AcrR family transcriptional regulator
MHESIPIREEVTFPRDDRRHALILAAYQSIAEKGFEGLRTREVAAAVGIHNATLHHYFPTKEALIQGVVDYAVQRLIQATISSHGSAREQLASFLEGFARQMEEEPTLFLVLAEFALRARRNAPLDQVLQANLTGQKTFLIQTLQAGMREGTWDQHLDAEATAMAISCFLQGVGSRLPLPKDQLKRTFAQLIHWLAL